MRGRDMEVNKMRSFEEEVRFTESMNWSGRLSKAMKRFKKVTDEKRRGEEIAGIQKRFKEINEDYDKEEAEEGENKEGGSHTSQKAHGGRKVRNGLLHEEIKGD
jgi:hypothetical protein